MISVKSAMEIIREQAVFLPVETIPLAEANARYLASMVKAAYEHPLFDMSAMDGYAFAKDGRTEWVVVGEVAAGDVFPRPLLPGEAVRIFTGAELPEGADTVVMQERVQREGDRITHTDAGLRYGGNVRIRGEHIQKGHCLADEGDILGPADIGMLATVGVRSVAVHCKPKVQVLITGNEFIEGAEPSPGRIFCSNDVILHSVLKKEGLDVMTSRVGDDAEALASSIHAGIASHDVLITTGGASVGDHDLIAPVLEQLGATIHFHGVAQKPGRPMLFATLNGKPIVALPGNPRAVLVLAWMYVLPLLRRMQRARNPWLRNEELPLASAFEMRGKRDEFRAAMVNEGTVFLLDDEGSHMLGSMTGASALAFLPAGERAWKAGEGIRIYHTPQ